MGSLILQRKQSPEVRQVTWKEPRWSRQRLPIRMLLMYVGTCAHMPPHVSTQLLDSMEQDTLSQDHRATCLFVRIPAINILALADWMLSRSAIRRRHRVWMDFSSVKVMQCSPPGDALNC